MIGKSLAGGWTAIAAIVSAALLLPMLISTSGNAATSATSVGDTTEADFAQGNLDSDTYIGDAAGGEVLLRPTAGSEFSGSALPSGWTSQTWATGQAGGSSVANGVVSVDGALLGQYPSGNPTDPASLYGPGRVLEFVGTITNDGFQHIGFGVDYNNVGRWAMFSSNTGAGGLWVRTNVNSVQTNLQLSSAFLGSPHRYRIVWTASAVTYFVDGQQVAQHVGPTDGMRPLISDYNAGGTAVSVDWLRMSPYSPSGTFTSRVLDAGASAPWGAFAATTSKPTGTDVAFSVRTGETQTPDDTWSSFSPISEGGTVGVTARYLQYRAQLTTTAPDTTPEVRDVSFAIGSGSTGCAAGQYSAEYFNNITLSQPASSTSCESAPIDYAWGEGGPQSAGVGANDFSVRWSGDFTFAAGAYTFTATADDGVRVFLDNELIIDEWRGQAPTTFEATRTLSAGTHNIRMEYYEATGGATAKLDWAAASSTACAAGRYSAEYFSGTELAGPATLSRCEDAPINKEYGYGGPGTGVGVDDFSVRWSGDFTFAAGAYTFTATADDGVRVFLDNELIIDEWRGQAPTTFEATRTLSAGTHNIRMEYYEATGGATAKLDWAAASSTACAAGRYSAEYFSGTELAGPATLSRCEDAPINKEYGYGGPGTGVGVDDFSVRWSGDFTFAAGAYTFTATADDGVRVFLDNELIIDEWRGQAPTTFEATRTLSAGTHNIRMEYYEATGGATAKLDWAAASSTACAAGRYSAEYFSGTELAGPATLSRCEDAPINKEYGYGGPGTGVGVDDFSVRWSGDFTFAAGAYTFTATADDGVRVFLDNELIIDEWRGQAPTTFEATRTLSAGTHNIRMEYYEATGGATAKLDWAAASSTACAAGRYSAEYFSGTELAGPATLSRCEDAPINKEYGYGGPGTGVGVDDFSVRWSGDFTFAAGAYTFTATADDGVRVFLDNELIIDEWRGQAPTTFEATRTLSAGTHNIRMEYYEATGGATAKLDWAAGGVAAPCDIACENAKPGDPPGEWDISGSGSDSIQGFATQMSVDQGETVNFKVDSDASNYRLDIYRLGWYGGNGARKQATIEPSAALPQNQPACLTDATGLYDCGNWSQSASYAVPTNAVSGVYIAKLVREDGTAGSSHIAFVVRDDDGGSDLLFQTADTTWQAYNSYGGKSLYVGGPKASKVSYNRPFNTRGTAPEDWVFNAEYPLIRWLERNGYDVSYTTDVDTDRRGGELLEHDAFLSVGHDEYWSAAQRANIEAARAAGVHLAFFSGNEIYWKTRWESSIDSSAAAYRTLVSYKEGTLGENNCGTKCDPIPTVWTGLWRDGCSYPQADGCRPENALSGQISWVDSTGAIQVPAADGKLRLWRNTSVANLAAGETATLAAGTLGYEWDAELAEYRDSYPGGRVWLSTTNLSNRTHHLSLYRHASGSLVFGAGTVQWSWGLDGTHDRGSSTADPRMQQATVNLLADMGASAATIQSGLVQASASTDSTAPTSTITAPQGGATVTAGQAITITGTAGDATGEVGVVEVSVDGGQTWRRATGRSSWSFGWTPSGSGSVTIKSRAADDSGNRETPSAGVTVTVGQGQANCPCSIWSSVVVPATPAHEDNQSVEVGVKFRTALDGFATGLRFYKGAINTGVHTGHLWTVGGQQLAELTFTGETASGWQEAMFASPVALVANTVYVASYHAPNGHYAVDGSYFAAGGVDNGPLHALGNGESQNGVYKYGPSGSFPNDTFNSANYWVDVVFQTSVGPDTTGPTVTSTAPAAGGSGVASSAVVTATFNEAVDPTTVSPSTFVLTGDNNVAVPASVIYDAPTRTARLDPNADLAASTTYTATVEGGAAGVKDSAGNPLAADKTWSFTTAAPPPPPPTEGPGGPILVLSSSSNPFGRYTTEILRTEGLNEFAAQDVSTLSSTTLAAHDVVVLGETQLTDGQVTLLSDWVNEGGNLIALRPDKRLAGLLGLTDAAGTLANAYLRVDTVDQPGRGITGETIQFHGTADRYSLSGATAVASLYTTATAADTSPAVTLRSVGANGGEAAAFTYDLARSIVLTRQGNPAWAGQSRDGQSGPIRSDNLFFGNASFDPQPDWVDLNKVAIPQADEQQRLLVNLIQHMNRDQKPLPRFWYLPRFEKAAVVMTGDDHGSGGTAGRFDQFKAASPDGCVVAQWECVRGSSYIYTSTPLSNAAAASYDAEGFEVGLHVDTGCANFTPSSLEANYAGQLPAWRSKYSSLPAPVSNRTHCIAWSDWATQPKVELQHGIRLDTNYYYWPGSWVQNRPGFFTGSGMPMRFADVDGTMIDVYQAATQMTDESAQSFPATVDTLLDRAIGAEGYYGVFTANMHTDAVNSSGADAIVASALARSVPVVTARQMLAWLDGRNGSSFGSLTWSGSTLSFDVSVDARANGLRALLPLGSATGVLSTLTRNGSPVAFESATIKGIEYAVFPALAGSYAAVYS